MRCMYLERTLGKAVLNFKPLTSSKKLHSLVVCWSGEALGTTISFFGAVSFPIPRPGMVLCFWFFGKINWLPPLSYIPYITLNRLKSGTRWYFDNIWGEIIIWQPPSRKQFYIQVFIILFASTLYYYYLFISTNKISGYSFLGSYIIAGFCSLYNDNLVWIKVWLLILSLYMQKCFDRFYFMHNIWIKS